MHKHAQVQYTLKCSPKCLAVTLFLSGPRLHQVLELKAWGVAVREMNLQQLAVFDAGVLKGHILGGHICVF